MNQQEEFDSVKIIALVVGILGIIAFVFISGCRTFHRVPAGHVAVVYGFGGDISGQRDSGLQFTPPWQHVKIVSVQRQVYRPDNKCENGQERCISTFSKDNQDVFVTATLNYRIDRENVQTLMRDNPNYVDRSIASRFQQLIKDETVKYSATDIAPNREQIRQDSRTSLARELANVGITVEDLLIDNIDFRTEFKAAIEAKVAAEQNALTEQNKVAVSEALARQRAAQAQGEADALRITAQGQADANRAVAASLTPELIQFQAVQKLSDKIQAIIVPPGIILDPSKLLAPQQ